MDFVHAIISFTAALAVSLSRHTLNIYLPIYTYHSHIEVIIPQIFPLSHPYSPPLLPLHILAQEVISCIIFVRLRGAAVHRPPVQPALFLVLRGLQGLRVILALQALQVLPAQLALQAL